MPFDNWNWKHKKSIASTIGQGDVFGSWTVTASPLGSMVPCQCSCGLKKLVKAYALKKGISMKCRGCACKETGEKNRGIKKKPKKKLGEQLKEI